MKRIGLLLCMLMLWAVSVSAQQVRQEKVNIRNQKMSLHEFIGFMENKTRITFVYDTQEVDVNQSLSLPTGVQTTQKIIDTAFKSTSVVASWVGDEVVLTPDWREKSYMELGGKRLSGTVVDPDGEPLVGASVLIAGSSRGVITDEKGKFSLLLIPGTKLVNVDFLGFKARKLIIDPQQLVVKLTLEQDTNTLDELVVIGYGTQTKRDITGAITSVSAKDIDRNVGGSIETSLQGRIPGLNIVQNSGEPGTSSTITLRGAASINGSSEPLYIVDGVPLSTESISSIAGDGASFNPLAGINPSDIESIEVLKDAASAAIYGSRAANGVIIVTTKGGNELKVQKPTIRINHNSSISVVSRHIDVMNSRQFREAYIDARTNAGLSVDRPWVTNPTHPYYANSTDWQSLMYRPAYQTKNDVSISGGASNFSYGVSLGYRDSKPIIVGTSHQQYSMRTNFYYKITDWLSAGTKIFYSRTDYNRVMTGQSNMSSAIRGIVSAPPVFSPYDYETGELINSLGSNEFRNPLAIALKYPITFGQDMFTANQFFRFTLAKGLEARVSLSMEKRGVEQSSYNPKEFDSNRVDTSRYSDTDLVKYMIENTLSYRKKWGSHSFDVLVGQSYQYVDSKVKNLVGRDYMDNTQLVIQNASIWSTVSQVYSQSALMSYFGRANYNYKSRYLAQFTLRCDGSSRFGIHNRYGVFPSASFGWRFTDERFMLFARNILTDGKLRASVGVTGNQKIGDYTWQGLYTTHNSNYAGDVVVMNSTLANNDLGWERTIQYNIGLDLTFFRGRILLNADAYIKDTDDLLFNAPLPGYTGFTKRSMNFGAIRNKGFELGVTTVNIDSRKFRWDTNFNIGVNRNEITALADGADVLYSTRGIYGLARVGEPVGVFYGWKALGVYASDSDNTWTDPETGATRPVKKGTPNGEPFKGGDMIWADINGDGVINDDDRVIIGNPHPDFTGGFGTTFSWNGLSLNVYFTFSYGNDIINSQRRLRNKMGQVMNFGTDALSRWRMQGDVTDFPMLCYGDAMDNFRPSTFTIEDGSYLRLKDVALSYSLPRAACKKLKISDLTISLTGSNLLLWSHYSGYDPEVNTSDTAVITGLDDGAFPKSRTWGIGVNLTF